MYIYVLSNEQNEIFKNGAFPNIPLNIYVTGQVCFFSISLNTYITGQANAYTFYRKNRCISTSQYKSLFPSGTSYVMRVISKEKVYFHLLVAQKRPGRPKKTWDEVLMDDRKKLGMDSADPQNRSEWRGRLRERLVKQAQPSVEENRL